MDRYLERWGWRILLVGMLVLGVVSVADAQVKPRDVELVTNVHIVDMGGGLRRRGEVVLTFHSKGACMAYIRRRMPGGAVGLSWAHQLVTARVSYSCLPKMEPR